MVIRSSDLAEAELKAGDEVRLDGGGRVAVELFAAAELQDYYFEQVPEIPWSKIGGQEKAIQVIRDTIELPLLYPELYARFDKKPLKGILLYGPPGCGKTLIGRATAYNLTQEYRKRTGQEVKEYFMYISGPKILNMWVGESERMVREIFATARQRAKSGNLVFIFIDEAEALLRTRSSGRVFDIANTVVPQFSAEMDGLLGAENVVVMLTSNRPDYIDPAILRPQRIDRKVKVERPGRCGSREILGIYLTPSLPLDAEFVRSQGGDGAAAREKLMERAIDFLFARNEETAYLEVHLRNARAQTLYWKDLVSGALIMSLVERAKDFAIKRAIETKSSSEGVSWEDLQRAIRLEYKENEIFPKTDAQEDWLKLLDYDPENVVSIHRLRPRTAPVRSRVV
jgi:proteasome-associated ATPase